MMNLDFTKVSANSRRLLLWQFTAIETALLMVKKILKTEDVWSEELDEGIKARLEVLTRIKKRLAK